MDDMIFNKSLPLGTFGSFFFEIKGASYRIPK